jgi:photosystem II stability/assembly factor-like uncharacterized protein
LKRLVSLTALFLASIFAGTHILRPANDSPKVDDSNSVLTFDDDEHERKKVDQPDKFLEYHRGIRTPEGATGPEYKPQQKWTELRSARQLAAARKKTNGRGQSNDVEFIERGPFNVPGRTRALLSVPGSAGDNTWLAGSATGGIWRTTDGGDSWTDVSRDFPALPISSFGCNEDGSVIYAATGEFVSSIFSASGNGIYKSTDKGLTWSVLPATANNRDFSITTRIAVDPSNANRIVATTATSNLNADQKSSIMRTTDGGATWVKEVEITGAFEQVIATPGNFNVMYASENGFGVWKSTDGGDNWTQSNSGMNPEGRVEIAISPVTPTRLFASAEGEVTGTGSDLYVSNDAGSTWSLVDVRFNNQAVDFLQGQGFYDNTILCDPFDDKKIYYGGVSLFSSTINNTTTAVDNFKITEQNTSSFLVLQSFSNIPYDNQRLDVGDVDFASDITVEVRFGPNESQSAHRFLVPEGATSGVAATSYSYNNYITVPFEVWDVTNNRQLMVSFRDQNRNNQFDLIPASLTSTDALQQSREYVYIHDITYSASPSAVIATAGGHEQQLRYNFFPALASGAVWNSSTLPASKLVIANDPLVRFGSSTVTVADSRDEFDNKNNHDQVDLTNGVHPDHHFIIPLNVNATAKTYRLLIANDGGVFVSKIASSPGTTEGDWTFKGFGMNTTQFYGADKAPGQERYIGGSQDNGTRISPPSTAASAQTSYSYALGGDGFEVLWHSKDASKIMGTIYNGNIYRTTNGQTWSQATNGFTPSSSEFSFVTKLASSKDYPDRVFTVGSSGVYVSNNFGGNWTLTPINSRFVIGTPLYLDVEVSRANANIIWAGSGMNNSGTLRSLFVSTNGGQSFQETNNFTTVSMGNITKLASHPSQPNTAYALFSFAGRPKILRTTNLGQTWEDISGFGNGSSSVNGFPDVAVYCLYVRTDDPNVIWAGTEIGIVESTDNGASWAIREDFPNVSVWDMKGQDNEVVLATHGRGIWSAVLPQTQEATPAPVLIASGTSPQERLMLRIDLEAPFDSLHLFVNQAKAPTIKNLTEGTYDVELSGISPGDRSLSMVGYRGSAPVQSLTFNVTLLDLLAKKDSYSTYFTQVSDLILDGLSLQSLTSSDRQYLQSSHDYMVNKDHLVFVRTPITVSDDLPLMYYSDIAIIEPGEDFVVVEATNNGLDWFPLKESYDASLPASGGVWLQAFTNRTAGTQSMFIDHEVDISETFESGDELLIRLRMVSGPSVTAWGWALSYIAIQERPVGVEETSASDDISIYPNPSDGNFTVEFSLAQSSKVEISIYDGAGKIIKSKSLGLRSAGVHSEAVTLGSVNDGLYSVLVTSGKEQQVWKLIIRN